MKDIKKWWKSLREKRREKRQMAHKKEGGREKRLEDSRRMPSPERLSLRCRLVRKLPGKHKRSSKGKEPLLGSERRSPGSGVGSTKPASEAGNSKPVNEAGNPEQVNEAGGEGPILPEIEGYGALNEFLHSLEPEPNRLRDFLLIDKLYKLLTWNTPIDINTLLGILRYRSSPAALVQAERQGTTRADAFRWTVPQGPVRMRAVHGNSVERLKLIKAMILAALEMSNPGNVHNSVSEQSEAAQDLQDLQDVPAYSSWADPFSTIDSLSSDSCLILGRETFQVLQQCLPITGRRSREFRPARRH
ncbi:hypothetical protein MMC30_004496 [Trapelia coarctata]|nr:hypothetical protein [Trapelia coarctata]